MAIATDAKLPQVPEDAPPATPLEVPEMEAEAIERVSAAEARAGQLLSERRGGRESAPERGRQCARERKTEMEGGRRIRFLPSVLSLSPPLRRTGC